MLKAFLLFLFSVTLYAEVVGGVAALVEGEPITLYEVRQAMQENKVDAQKAVDLLTREKLEEIEARNRGVNVGTHEVFEEIKNLAQQNGLNTMEFYDAVYRSQGLTEEVLKTKIRTQLTNRKLYNKIAFSQIEQPSAEEEEEYYQIHLDDFQSPKTIKVVAYRAQSKARLEAKVNNPMLYAPDIANDDVTFSVATLPPNLAEVLLSTKLNTFTPVLPGQQGGFVSFYIVEHGDVETAPLESVRAQINQLIMTQKRQQVLNDYFTRLRMTADVQVIRLPN